MMMFEFDFPFYTCIFFTTRTITLYVYDRAQDYFLLRGLDHRNTIQRPFGFTIGTKWEKVIGSIHPKYFKGTIPRGND